MSSQSKPDPDLRGSALDSELNQKPSRSFIALDQSSYTGMEHAASLKGLLKPFKGKGELEHLLDQCVSLQAGLVDHAMYVIIPRVTRYPFTLLPIRLTQQTAASGTVFLRWRRCDRSKMGADVWREVIEDARTPDWMLEDLHAVELQRVALNMQISLIHTIARQARECAEKMGQADTAISTRRSSYPSK